MLCTWKTKVYFFKQSLYVFFKQSLLPVILKFKQNFVTYNNGSINN